LTGVVGDTFRRLEGLRNTILRQQIGSQLRGVLYVLDETE
jgi:hypothetical protein